MLPISQERAWAFFSSPFNLARITPANLDFRIVNLTAAEEIFEGMIIEYLLKPLFGVTVRWKTGICDVQPPYRFTDIQLNGPYQLWEHRHTFTKTDEGVLVRDEVKYRMPMGLFGRLVHAMIVKKRIENIFDYRRQMLRKLFCHE